MTTDRIDPLINDAEINYIADLFLACFGLDRGTRRYRCFRNAVVAVSSGAISFSDALPLLAECADLDPAAYLAYIDEAVAEAGRPLNELFDLAYSPAAQAGPRFTMPAGLTAGEAIDFLGTVLLYFIAAELPKYKRINILRGDDLS